MNKSSIIAILLMLTLIAPSMHAQRKFVDRTTDVLCLVPTATATVLTLVNHDEKGFKQLALSTLTGTALSYSLSFAIRKNSPDGSTHHAFPSNHTAITFSGAAFLQRRYGWKWGAPAYAISAYVAWGRCFARKHDVWDVLAGAAIGAGGSYIFSRPFMKGTDVAISPALVDGHKCIDVAITF